MKSTTLLIKFLNTVVLKSWLKWIWQNNFPVRVNSSFCLWLNVSKAKMWLWSGSFAAVCLQLFWANNNSKFILALKVWDQKCIQHLTEFIREGFVSFCSLLHYLTWLAVFIVVSCHIFLGRWRAFTKVSSKNLGL